MNREGRVRYFDYNFIKVSARNDSRISWKTMFLIFRGSDTIYP